MNTGLLMTNWVLLALRQTLKGDVDIFHLLGDRISPKGGACKDWIMPDVAEAISGPVCHVPRGFAGHFMNTTKHAKMALQHNKITQQSNSENVTGGITQNTHLLVAITVARKARSPL